MIQKPRLLNDQPRNLLLLVAATSLLLLSYRGVCAFESEIFNQAVIAWNAASSLSVNELFFAAANLNLLDSQQQQRQPQLPLQQRFPATKLSVPDFSQSLPLPQVNFDLLIAPGAGQEEESFYDYYFANNDVYSIKINALALKPDEVELFDLVRKVRDCYCPSTTIRVAGGWVRDKLLGKTSRSHDIDFVLSNQLGSEFAKHFYDYVVKEEKIDSHENVYYVNSVHDKVNLQSHYLQTASIQFRNFNLDFGNLRFEKYQSQNSRVPSKSGIATVVEDAWRRDLTINSLFYNIHTNQVEDWTEQGLADLQLGVIATPFAPLTTLLEDPLRILRAVRFASQLSFSMDPALKKAARDTKVRRAIQQKVSKDRMGQEINAVFQTNDPSRGIRLLLETNLVDLIFPLDDNSDVHRNNGKIQCYKHGFESLCRTQALVSRVYVSSAQWDEEKRRLLWYAAFFKPLCDKDILAKALDKTASRRRRRDESLLYRLLTVALKRPTSDTQSIERIIAGVQMLRDFLLAESEHEGNIRTTLEQLVDGQNITFASSISETKDHPSWNKLSSLRWDVYQMLKEIGPFWKESLLLALANEDDMPLRDKQIEYQQWVYWIEVRLGLTEKVLFDPQTSFSKNPLLNGSEISQSVLPRLQPGRDFQRIMKAQEEWQVRNNALVISGGKQLPNGASWNSEDEVDNQADISSFREYLIRTFPEYS